MRFAGPVLVVLAAVTSASGSSPWVRVVAETPEGVTLQVTAVPITVADDAAGSAIETPGAGQLREAGRPLLPAVRALVALPPATVARLVLEPSQDAAVPIGPLARWRASAAGEFDFAESESPDPAGPWPASPARIAWQGRLRGQDVALVEFFPVRWHAAAGQLLVAADLVARIRFEAVAGAAVAQRGPDPADLAELRALVVSGVVGAGAPAGRPVPLLHPPRRPHGTT